MKARLSLISDDLEGEDLQDLARGLCSNLNEETDVSASLEEGPGEPGDKGDPITVGTLILAFVTSGSAVALIQVLKTIFERKPLIEVELEREDGGKLRIRAEHLSPGQMERTLVLWRDFFGTSK